MATTGEAEWIDPSMDDLLILGTALIRRHDKGLMTDGTIEMYVDGVCKTYGLTPEQCQELTKALEARRFK